MKLLSAKDVIPFIKERHAQTVASLPVPPRLAILRMGDEESTNRYLRVKRRYGEDIGVPVDVYAEGSRTLLDRIKTLNEDAAVTGIIVQLPLTDTSLTGPALAAVAPEKDVDGLAPGSTFEPATPKAALWLLASYNVDIAGHIVVVGQGRLVGKPLAGQLEASGQDVTRCDIHTIDLKAETIKADIIFTATGQEHLIKSDMVKPGAVIVDAGAPLPELDPALYERDDLTLTPNPGGVGPMTVCALFDNLLIAAQAKLR